MGKPGDTAAGMTPERRRDPHTGRWLGCFFLALYLLTMGGHTNSSDEESLLLVARSLVERGRLDVPGEWAETSSVRLTALDGRQYTPYGVLPSVLLVPFVVAGKALAAVAPPSHREWVLRLVANLLDPVVTAAACVLLFRCALDLGFAATTSRSVALAFGGATIAWPYSKWLWSEPVAGLALLAGATSLFRSLRRPGVAWPFLAGLAVTAAMATKATEAVVLPGFVVCLALPPRREAGRRIAAFLSPLVLGGLGFAAWNRFRFGNALETGYQLLGAGLSAFDFSNPLGTAGLLVSPGKSVFLYSPVLLVAVAGMRRFARTHPREALLIGWICAGHVALFGAYFLWHGDESWGPRFLVPITALALLPAGSFLERESVVAVRRAARVFGVTVAAGLLVQISGVLVNYAAYTTRTGAQLGPDADRRRWVPSLSPVLGHGRLFWRRLADASARARAPARLEGGFSWPEVSDGSLFPRWTTGDATILIPAGSNRRISIDYRDPRPEGLPGADLELSVGGEGGCLSPRFDAASRSGVLFGRLGDSLTPERVVLSAVTWRPAEITGSLDERELGVLVDGIRIVVASRPVRIGDAGLPEFPVSAEHPWGNAAMGWFYGPTQHIADVWVWYLWTSGLPRPLVALVLLPAGLFVLAAWKLCRTAPSV